MPIVFEHDPHKAATNLSKHGVGFDEACSVFLDKLASTTPDEQHSEAEDRWTTVGLSKRGRLLFVVYTERDSRVRLIGARPATLRERREYEEGT